MAYAMTEPLWSYLPRGRRRLLYPSSFEYFAPDTLEEAVGILERFDGDAKVLAGGQSLIPVMKLRTFAAPAALVDINRIPELATLTVTRDGGLKIGALVRHKDCERSELLDGTFATLGDAAPQISDPIVRNLGTVCGSLAHADPQGDWGSALLAARASAVVRGPEGERTVPVEELALGPFMTTLAPDEVITEVRVPDPGPRASGTYLKLERKVGDFATAAVGVQVSLDNGHVGEVGIGLTGVGATNLRAKAAEDSLRGAEPTDDAIRLAAELAADAAEPQADHRGSVDYKRNVVRVFCERGLRTAISAAQAGEEGRS
jgi:aerobic carbon-monoxide dehydrogenase medium subunit